VKESAYPVHKYVSQFHCLYKLAETPMMLPRLLYQGERTNAHRRLHTRQLGLIHNCGREKMGDSVEEAIAANELVGGFEKFVGERLELHNDGVVVYAP
jgi:hypothetical protein